MTDCQPEKHAGRWACSVCGRSRRVLTSNPDTPPRRTCRPRRPGPPDENAEAAGLAVLLAALDDLTSQPHKRHPDEVGRLLALCQRCDDFHAGQCRVYDGCASQPRLTRVLTDPALSCPDWPALRAAVEGQPGD